MGELVCEVTFCELRCKQVVNVVDGKCLGHIIDIVFDLKCGRILGLVTPGWRRWFWFRPREDIFIPWRNVCKIGDDVILVELKPRCGGPAECFSGKQPETVQPDHVGGPVGAEAHGQNERRYEQYYDVYDIPDKET